MASHLACEKHWAEKPNNDNAEKKYYEYLAQLSLGEKSVCPNVAQKSVTPEGPPKPEVPKVDQSPPASVSAAVTQNGEQTKVKKEKKRNKKNKKDASQSPDPAPPAVITEPPKLQAAPQPTAPIATEEVSKEQTKKKAKKSKKNKTTQEVAVGTVNDTTAATNNILTEKVQQENTKNLKEKENLAHKLCGNITEEINKISTFPPAQCTLASEISKARQHIKNSLERMDGIAALAASPGAELLDRLSTVEKENEKLRAVIDGLNKLVIDLHGRVKTLESGSKVVAATAASKSAAPAPAKKTPAPANDEEDDDDDVDLFGSDDEAEDKEAAELREKRLADYAAKKSKKPALIAKSNIILDIKPWDDETDMKKMEEEVRKISTDGLLLGASKLVPLAYGIHKLQMSCVIEDDKVSVDWLQEEIEKIEDYVQSVDIAAFNKI